MKLRDIEILVAIMRAGSITGAASVLHVTQPAVSMALKSIEASVGLRFFNRVGGRLRPTAAARALVPDALAILSEMQAFQRHAARLREGTAGMLTLAATPALAASFLTVAMAHFRKERPRVRVMVRSVATELVVELVAHHQVDFGLVYAPAGNAATEAEDLCGAEIACIVRHDDPLAGRRVVTPADVAARTVISYRPETPLGRQIARTFRDAGVQMAPEIQISSFSACRLVAMGVGVALVDPLVLLEGSFDGLNVLPFRPATVTRVQMLMPRGHALSATALQFREELRVMVQQYRTSHGFLALPS